MENVVSARRLRKSVLKDIDPKSIDINRELGIDLGRHFNKNNMNSNEGHLSSYNYDFSATEKEQEEKKFKLKFKTIFLAKVFISVLIIFTCLICKMFFSDKLANQKAVMIITNEYKNDYSKEYVLDRIEEISKSAYKGLKYVIPANLANSISNKYVSSVKPKVLAFKLNEFVSKILNSDASTVKVEKNTNVKENENESSAHENEEYDGKGGGEPAEITKIIEEASAVSIMQDDLGQIVSKNISMIKPISGTITSNYGARDQIFDGVTSYHTGLDIATKKGVEIKSSTEGKVIKVQNNDKYYGNNILVETNGVTFKYAHMDSIKVKLNDSIKQGDILGYVGNTGMSTGPHLHFEISIHSRTVDPTKLISF
ncbi:MAG: M23 family metallopeptidase [Clostridia bacterium]|nr:M23 family metallopeptidase [Clostridia bacterium]